ncbi:MAG: MoxR family ATPase [Candidatus Omnitrophica bacterium]|nr:MoxR family ATPase [Candidatus Omnitrophota bacterium]
MSLSNEQASQLMKFVCSNLGKVIQGKQEKIELVVLALVAGGHVLIEDIPGVGKTTLARSLAKTVDGKFNRIQFTPDLLPTDITGNNIFNQKESSFTFNPGPLFANILLADEINRASPRTQSALLEAMSEETVTVDGYSHPLPAPFIVLATQNPIDYHGTYPLPEAQLDRFMMQIDIGYPPLDKEEHLLLNRTRQDPVDLIQAVLSLDDLEKLRALIDTIQIEKTIAEYLLKIVHASRQHPQLRLGVSTRGTLLYGRVIRARALLQGRDYILPDDVKELAVPVLAHRILLDTKAQYGGVARANLIAEIVDSIKVPR